MAGKDLVNPTYGETAQESVDRMAGQGKVDGGIKGPIVPQRPAPANIHPSAKGVYGAPIGPKILN